MVSLETSWQSTISVVATMAYRPTYYYYYIHFRAACGLDTYLPGGLVAKLSDLTNIEPEQLSKIEKSYNSPADIDLLAGGVSERPQAGSIFGETFTCLIARSFKRYRFGDVGTSEMTLIQHSL